MTSENLNKFVWFIYSFVQLKPKFERYNLVVSAVNNHYRAMNVPDVIDCSVAELCEPLDRHIRVEFAADADELFVAGTTFDIVPVVKFDDKTIGNGTPGEYTKLLINRFISFTV